MSVDVARLDSELVRRGLARSRSRAAELVGNGRVRIGDTLAKKPSQQVDPEAPLAVAEDPGEREYVSRAAHKLAGALDALVRSGFPGPRVTGARCLDAGASTGGFTQVLLERGASHVEAVDVGHAQIAPEVADDPRVTVREGVNVRELPSDLAPVDLVVADLSFISLTVVLPALLAATKPTGELLLMVKPQFEVGRARLGASGVVSSADLRTEAVSTVASAAGALGAEVLAVVPSPLPGPAGNKEYFLWLRPGGSADERGSVAGADGRGAVQDAVRRAVHEIGRAHV